MQYAEFMNGRDAHAVTNRCNVRVLVLRHKRSGKLYAVPATANGADLRGYRCDVSGDWTHGDPYRIYLENLTWCDEAEFAARALAR